MRFHRDHRSDWRCRSGATKQAEPKGGGWKLGREADRLLLHASRRDRARNSRRRRPRTEPDRPVLRVPLWYGLGSRDAIKGFAVSGREDSAFLTGDKAQYKVAGLFNYPRALEDGTVFDSSYKRGKPLTFRVGEVRTSTSNDSCSPQAQPALCKTCLHSCAGLMKLLLFFHFAADQRRGSWAAKASRQCSQVPELN
jgi:hypothetical protein